MIKFSLMFKKLSDILVVLCKLNFFSYSLAVDVSKSFLYCLTRWPLFSYILDLTKKCCQPSLLASKEPTIFLELVMKKVWKILVGFAPIFQQPFLKEDYLNGSHILSYL